MSRRKQARPSRATLEDELLAVQGALRLNPQSLAAAVNAAAAAAAVAAAAVSNQREDNDSVSEGEDSAVGGAIGDEAVDLTSARSHHEDELLDERDPEDHHPPLVQDLADDEDQDDEPDEAQDDFDQEPPPTQQPPRGKISVKKLRQENDDDEEGSCKRMRLCQDAENNNSFVEGGAPAGVFPPAVAAAAAAAGTSHVTLEALQNTSVAVAQFAATALGGGADSEAARQQLAVLQSTLYTLEHQRVFHLQLINQLQQQLSITATAPPPPASAEPSSEQPAQETRSKEPSPAPTALIHPKPLSSLTSPAHSRPPSSLPRQPSPSSTPIALPTQERPTPAGSASPLSVAPGSTGRPGSIASPPTNSNAPLPPSHQVPALCSISSSLASSIITNNDPMPLHEPNTLEMLQKRAQEVLDNASQGLLANNLADELAFRNSKGSRLSPYDGKSGGGRSEPFFKHRCRYCGKVFGSDSALQIHIRSHTGERPFKCNVCGSRFTTKGNLKVHFQRHKDKFPHVKMNPNPVPEHLDKYHPPLLQQLAACGQRPPPSPPPPPPPMPPHSAAGLGPHLGSPGAPPFHGAHPGAFLPPQPPLPLSLAMSNIPSSLYRSPLMGAPMPREDQDAPADLSKPVHPVSSSPTPAPRSATHSPIHSPGVQPNSHHSYNEHSQKLSQQLTQEQRDEIVKREQEQSPIRDYQAPRPSSHEGPAPSDRITPKNEPQDPDEINDDEGEEFDEDPSRRFANSSPNPAVSMLQQQMYEDCSMDSKNSNGRMERDPEDMEGDEDMDDQPENLSSRANPASMLQQSMIYPGASPASSSASSGSLQTSFANILFPGLPPHPQLASHLAQGGNPPPPPGPPPSDMIDPAKDPAIYSNLLPRPGSNDNSWESLIEITKTSETSKLQQLVDNIEHKLTDPNQCIICQRVLSCKSALQMHYRTHTGERPFKCRICSRAFTTKGNLKTHMGVHRAKPPLRLLHQCTVCHKKFANSFVLQQHVNLHTNDPTELTPEQIRAHEVHDFPPGYPHHPLAALLPGGFPPLHPAGFPLGFPPTSRQHTLERPGGMENDNDSKDSLHLQQQHLQQLYQQRFKEEHGMEEGDDIDDEEEDHREDDERCGEERRSSLDGEEDKDQDMDHDVAGDHKDNLSTSSPPVIPSFSASLAALEGQVRTITTMANSHHHSQPKSPPLMHRYNGSEKSNSPPVQANASAPLDLTPRASSTPASASLPSTSPPQHLPPHPPHPHPFGMFAGLLQAVSTSPTANNVPPGAPGGPNAVSPGPLASLTSSAVRAATSTYNPLGLAVGGSSVRGTTCNICYKTFACHSALEIHYRSHTKERPFKCTICDRGFSTKQEEDEAALNGNATERVMSTSTTGMSQEPKCDCAKRARRSAREKARRRRKAEERRQGRMIMLAAAAAAGAAAAAAGGDSDHPGGVALAPGAAAYAAAVAAGLQPDSLLLRPPPPPPAAAAATAAALPPSLPAPAPAPSSALGPLLPEPPVLLGNMKQHMLTHKIRDMPHHLFGDSKPPPPIGGPPSSAPTSQPGTPSSQPSHGMHEQHLRDERSRSPMSADESNLPPQQPPPPPPPSQMPPQPQPPPPPPPTTQLIPTSPLDGPLKKGLENEMPPGPKRPPSMSSKHLCQVCNKNFSSSSALQIHMRTHTGDKPFQCTICQKAFTTKGNLKVHMGTHMWANGASRRGRRMSLDIPSLPITPKDSEFLQRRPDLFYPYLPAPFLNGMPQKLNEISVIQGAGGNGLPPSLQPSSHNKYAGLFGSVYSAGFNHLGAAGGGMDKPPPPHQQPQQPHHPHQPMDMPKSVLFQAPSPPSSPGQGLPWNTAEALQRYDREGGPRPDSAESPPRLPPPRGEGLAA